MARRFYRYGFPLIFLLLAACGVAGEMTPTAGVSPTPVAPPTPTPTAPPTPTPYYTQSDAERFTAELGQLFALRWNQAVEIPAEQLVITHTVEIEFECPDMDAAELSCEVPLIATDYFTLEQNGQLLGIASWEPVMGMGDYTLYTTQLYDGYDYRKHEFEIVLSVEKTADGIATQQTRAANPALAAVSAKCQASQYIAGQPGVPEVHVLSVAESARYDDAVDVYVERTAAPLILILSSQKSTKWQIHPAEGVAISAIILNGPEPQTISGAGEIPVTDLSSAGSFISGAPLAWEITETIYRQGVAPRWIYEMEKLAGAPLASFTGCEKVWEFAVRDK